DAVHVGALSLRAGGSTNRKYLLLATLSGPTCRQTYEPLGSCQCPTGRMDNGQGFCCDLSQPGMPVCSRCEYAVQDAKAAVSEAPAAGIHPFVVGINPPWSLATDLDDLAAVGQEPRLNAWPRYYPVATPTDMADAIKTIAGNIIACKFPLPIAPS